MNKLNLAILGIIIIVIIVAGVTLLPQNTTGAFTLHFDPNSFAPADGQYVVGDIVGTLGSPDHPIQSIALFYIPNISSVLSKAPVLNNGDPVNGIIQYNVTLSDNTTVLLQRRAASKNKDIYYIVDAGVTKQNTSPSTIPQINADSGTIKPFFFSLTSSSSKAVDIYCLSKVGTASDNTNYSLVLSRDKKAYLRPNKQNIQIPSSNNLIYYPTDNVITSTCTLSYDVLANGNLALNSVKLGNATTPSRTQPENSVIGWLKALNAAILSKSPASTGQVYQLGLTATGGAATSEGGLMKVIGNPNLVKVSVVDILGTKYYSASFKDGFDTWKDNLCLESDDVVPGLKPQKHGSYCFYLEYGEFLGDTGFIVKRFSSGREYTLACRDWNPASKARILSNSSSFCMQEENPRYDEILKIDFYSFKKESTNFQILFRVIPKGTLGYPQ